MQAILTFAMSCLSIPKSMCNKLSNIARNFWWEGNGDARKIHWKAWVDVIKLNSKGGLGVRDYKGFNVALLVKQC